MVVIRCNSLCKAITLAITLAPASQSLSCFSLINEEVTRPHPAFPLSNVHCTYTMRGILHPFIHRAVMRPLLRCYQIVLCSLTGRYQVVIRLPTDCLSIDATGISLCATLAPPRRAGTRFPPWRVVIFSSKGFSKSNFRAKKTAYFLKPRNTKYAAINLSPPVFGYAY